MLYRLLSGVALVFVIFLLGPRSTNAEPDKAELAQKAQAILKTNCYRCHGANESAEGGVNYVLNQPRLLSTKKVVPGDSKGSKLYKQIVDEVMPPAKDADGKPVKQRPSVEDIAVIKQWIEAGAPDFKK